MKKQQKLYLGIGMLVIVFIGVFFFVNASQQYWQIDNLYNEDNPTTTLRAWQIRGGGITTNCPSTGGSISQLMTTANYQSFSCTIVGQFGSGGLSCSINTQSGCSTPPCAIVTWSDNNKCINDNMAGGYAVVTGILKQTGTTCPDGESNGQNWCVGNNVYTCNAGTDTYVKDCTFWGQVCSGAGICTSSCIFGNQRCNGQVVEWCDTPGWTPMQTCVAPKVCEEISTQTASCVNSGTCGTEGQSCGYTTESADCCTGLTCQNFGCYPSAVCGDNICQSTETMTSCPADCGTAPVCGNGVCDIGETTGATYDCPADCGGTTCIGANPNNNCCTCEAGEWICVTTGTGCNPLPPICTANKIIEASCTNNIITTVKCNAQGTATVAITTNCPTGKFCKQTATNVYTCSDNVVNTCLSKPSSPCIAAVWTDFPTCSWSTLKCNKCELNPTLPECAGLTPDQICKTKVAPLTPTLISWDTTTKTCICNTGYKYDYTNANACIVAGPDLDMNTIMLIIAGIISFGVIGYVFIKPKRGRR